MPRRIRGRTTAAVFIDEMVSIAFPPTPKPQQPMSLTIVEKNGKYHVYETTTEPWALVTAYTSEDEAKAYIGLGGAKAGVWDVKVSGWYRNFIQDVRPCIVCNRKLEAGTDAHSRSVQITLDKDRIETRYEAKCLSHRRTRFNRDEPI